MGQKKVSFGSMGDCDNTQEWGGLGVKSLRVFNKALFREMVVEIRAEVQSLRRGVIIDKYGVMAGDWRTNDIIVAFVCEVSRNG